MVKNLCLENYKAAANSALKFPSLREHILRAVNGIITQELRAYSKGKSAASSYDMDVSTVDFS